MSICLSIKLVTCWHITCPMYALIVLLLTGHHYNRRLKVNRMSISEKLSIPLVALCSKVNIPNPSLAQVPLSRHLKNLWASSPRTAVPVCCPRSQLSLQMSAYSWSRHWEELKDEWRLYMKFLFWQYNIASHLWSQCWRSARWAGWRRLGRWSDRRPLSWPAWRSACCCPRSSPPSSAGPGCQAPCSGRAGTGHASRILPGSLKFRI